MKTQVKDFIGNPLLKELMVNYFHLTHEMSATDEELIIEYHSLVENNKVYLIFECELITEYAKHAGVPVEES